jgi:hypothetical protein
VLDVSFSTQSASGGTCGGDQNGDGNSDTILIARSPPSSPQQHRRSAGTVGRVGFVAFGGKNVLDPATREVWAGTRPAAGLQFFTGPGTDADPAGGRDLNQVVNSVRSTNFPDIGGPDLFTPRTRIERNELRAAGASSGASRPVTRARRHPPSPAG